MITSAHNPKIQWVRKLLTQSKARRAAGAWVIEGVRLVEEAYLAGWLPQVAFYCAELSERGQGLLAQFSAVGVPLEQVTPQVMKSISDTQTPQGLVAVIALPELPLPLELNFLLVLDCIRDPGNLGTILRTSAAAGVQAVLLTPGSVDPWAPKVVRSAMGAHLRLPIQALTWEQLMANLDQATKNIGLQVYLADARGERVYSQVDFRQPIALLIGGEAAGAGSLARQVATMTVAIPMPGKAESLNAAIAAGILIFEVVRQRTSP